MQRKTRKAEAKMPTVPVSTRLAGSIVARLDAVIAGAPNSARPTRTSVIERCLELSLDTVARELRGAR